MPLPKMPTRPATLLDISTVKTATATRASRKPEDNAVAPAEPAKKTTQVTQSAKAPVQPQATPVAAKKSSRKTASKQADVTASAIKTTPATAEKKTVIATKTVATHVEKPVVQKPASTRTKKKPQGPAKLFVLDTNVLLHDPSCLFRFEEHDIFLPMMTLEELDHQKKGMSEVARNARQVSRWLDELVGTSTHLDEGLPLSALGHQGASGRLYFQTKALNSTLPADLPMAKADNHILGVIRALHEMYAPREVVLVSKDINMRLKARALGLAAEDYFNDQVLEDTDLLYSGVLTLPEDVWNKQVKDVESWQQAGMTFYRIHGPLCTQFMVNQFVHVEGALPLMAQVREVSGQTAVLATLRDYSHAKNNVWGILARNPEQNFALNLLMDPDCDFVSLLGQAGTGKTLLALAAGLTQVLETKRYSEIIMTRVTVPVGDDIGFLPGTEEEKMLPWMGALEDNLEVLNMDHEDSPSGWGRTATLELIRSKIKIKSMNFMRGRTFLNKYLIIDEAQNLTPKQMKTLITRAGPGTKVICLGNIAQIDTPYLTEGSSGLTYVVDRIKGWPHAGHITLQRGERSRLADYAADVL